MFKKIISLILVLNLFSLPVCFALDNFGDNTNFGDDTIKDEINFLESEVYKIEGNYVLGVEPGTSVSNFKKRFTNSEKINVSSTTLKTGVTVNYNGNDTHTIVVDGDVYKRDGKVTATDLVKINDYASKRTTVKSTSLEFKAADIDRSGSITVVDVIIAKSIILS